MNTTNNIDKNCLSTREKFMELNTPGRGLAFQPEVAAHVAGCAECSHIWKSLTETMRLLDTWEAPELSPFFSTRLNAQLDSLRAEEEAALQTLGGRIRAALRQRGMFGLPQWQPAMMAVLVLA